MMGLFTLHHICHFSALMCIEPLDSRPSYL